MQRALLQGFRGRQGSSKTGEQTTRTGTRPRRIRSKRVRMKEVMEEGEQWLYSHKPKGGRETERGRKDVWWWC